MEEGLRRRVTSEKSEPSGAGSAPGNQSKTVSEYRQLIRKWRGGAKHEVEAVEGEMRKIVPTDLILYFLEFILTPLAPVIDKYATYPLGDYQPAPWKVIVVALCFFPMFSSLYSFERIAPFILVMATAALISYYEALNLPYQDGEIQKELQKYPISLGNDEHATAWDWYNSVHKQSHYDSTIHWMGKESKKQLPANVISILAGLGLAFVGPFFRCVTVGVWHTFGSTWLSIPCGLASASLVGIMSIYLFRKFYQTFLFIRSMRNGMRRLRYSTVGPHTHNSPSKFKVDISNPDNLRAWLQVHSAMRRREKDIDGKNISISVGCTLILMVLVALPILFPTLFLKHTPQLAHDHGIMESIVESQVGSVAILLYVVLVMGISLICVTKVGDEYNFSVKRGQANNLYDIQLKLMLDYYSSDWRDEQSRKKDGEKRIEEVRLILELLPKVQIHINDRIADMAIFGFSYSTLYYWVISLASGTVMRFVFSLL